MIRAAGTDRRDLAGKERRRNKDVMLSSMKFSSLALTGAPVRRKFAVMPNWKKPWFIEGGFLVALLAVCIVLTTLQSRWNADLGRAAGRQQNAQLHRQAPLFCRGFDSQYNEASAQLRPSGEQIASLGREEAHAQCLRRWQAGGPRRMFRRLAVAVPERGSTRLYLLDQTTARLTPANWPAGWSALHDNLAKHLGGAPPQIFKDPAGFLREHPVFGSEGPGGPGDFGETEWIITELDPDYLRQTWLPELTQAYFNPGREIVDDVVVRTQTSPPETLFTTGSAEIPVGSEPAVLGFNANLLPGPMDGDNLAGGDTPWTLYAWPRSGELTAAVSTARARDFTLAYVLDAFLLIGGLLIIHYARRARRLGDARMQFVAAVSHELRTPLTVIHTAGQNLGRGIVHDPKRLEKYAAVIVKHSARLADMVEQVLAFAGAKRNESTLARRPVSVAQVVQEAIAECADEARAAGCEVQATAEGDLPTVLGDAHALRRVFQNLLANAVKHGGHGKWIRVRTRYVNGSSPGQVVVEVTDYGLGIPAREQTQVFEPFFRGSRARGQQTRGSGIGLSVVQEIVKVHGGSVRVESEVNRGAVFIVSLPATSTGEPS